MNTAVENTREALNDFFILVQAKAFRQAEFAVKNRDEALDIVQGAMEKLARKYANQPQNWGPLFQRILQNAIRDWYRRQKLRRFFSLSTVSDKLEEPDLLPGHTHLADDGVSSSQVCLEAAFEPTAKSAREPNPEHALLSQEAFERARQALALLPLRQQQAFILRAWWGHDVAETAYAMNCSQGSVKTHYARAVQRLRSLLEV